MKFISKLLMLVLAVIMVTSVSACNQEDGAKSNADATGYAFEYEVKDKTVEGKTEKHLKITGLYLADSQKQIENLVIDENLPVKDLDDNKKEQYKDSKLLTKKLSEVVDFNNIDYFEIGDDAFANQTAIENVVISEKVTNVGSACFAGCSNLKSMTIAFVGNEMNAKNVKKSFGYVFGSVEVANCTSTTMNYNETGSQTYFIPNSLEKVTVTAQTEIPQYAFSGLTNLKQVVLQKATKLGESAFSGCSKLTNVDLSAVEEVGKNAFNGCTSLANVTLTNVKFVREGAFNGCSSLGNAKTLVEGSYEYATLVLPNAVYETKAFYGCTSLRFVDLSNVETVAESMFGGCTLLEKVVLKAGATVNVNAFSKCEKLEKDNVQNYDELTMKYAFDFYLAD